MPPRRRGEAHCAASPSDGNAFAALTYCALRTEDADSVTVADIDDVFTRDNPLFAKLEQGLAGWISSGCAFSPLRCRSDDVGI
ncbi:MAG: hypothetical protein E6G97_20385 [Alphaproteobacteria bacterium]|nr:MAG: hypothetical protein E6G97_20385 [Alphaproteobacteria bacterium]